MVNKQRQGMFSVFPACLYCHVHVGMGRQSRRVADPSFPLDPVQFLTDCHVESLQDHSHARGLKRDCWRLAAWLSAVSTLTMRENRPFGSSYMCSDSIFSQVHASF